MKFEVIHAALLVFGFIMGLAFREIIEFFINVF